MTSLSERPTEQVELIWFCSSHPETPKLTPKPGDSDSAFSFPVTPPSEPPAAAEPGAVFGTWPSLKGSTRKLGSKASRACTSLDRVLFPAG